MASINGVAIKEPPQALELVGTDGDDRIFGDNDSETIKPGLGNDEVNGALKDTDTLVVDYSRVQSDYGLRYTQYTPGSGSATIYISKTPQTPRDLKSNVASVHFAGIERLNITGTAVDDEFPDTPLDDVFNGGKGNDTFTHYYSKNNPQKGDRIDGGLGKDTIEVIAIGLGDTNFQINKTSPDAEAIIENDGTILKNIEILHADTRIGNDYIYWNSDGNDVIKTGESDDFILSGAGNDFLDGGTKNDSLIGVNPFATSPGQGEIDYILTGGGVDTIYIGDRNKVYYDGNTYQWTGDDSLGAAIAKIMPNASPENITKYTGSLYEAMNAFDITTPARMRAFLAQIAVESSALNRTEENLNYRTEQRLLAVYPSFFKKTSTGQIVDNNNNFASSYLNNPEALGNYVYGSKFGNSEADDGYRYRGRGLKQITFKDNYQAIVNSFKNVLGRTNKSDSKKVDPLVDFIAKPDLLKDDPEYAALSAASYWNNKRLNSVADQLANAKNEDEERDIFDKITKGVAGSLQAADERWKFYKTAKTVINNDLGTYIKDREHALIQGLNSETKLFLKGKREDYFLVDGLKYEQGIDYDLVVNQYKTFTSFPISIGIVYDENNNRILDQGDDLIALALNSKIPTVESALNFI